MRLLTPSSPRSTWSIYKRGRTFRPCSSRINGRSLTEGMQEHIDPCPPSPTTSTRPTYSPSGRQLSRLHHFPSSRTWERITKGGGSIILPSRPRPPPQSLPRAGVKRRRGGGARKGICRQLARTGECRFGRRFTFLLKATGKRQPARGGGNGGDGKSSEGQTGEEQNNEALPPSPK